jgi:hypothetical protein
VRIGARDWKILAGFFLQLILVQTLRAAERFE